MSNYSTLMNVNKSPIRLLLLKRRLATHPAILYGSSHIKSPLVHLHSRISNARGATNSNVLHFAISKRSISNFPKIISRVIRLPIYVGGGMAAAGSYIAYKMEEASSFTKDKLDRIKDFGESMKEKFNRIFSGDESQNGDNGNDGTVPTATLIAATSLEDDEGKKQEEYEEEDDDDENDENDAVDTTQDEMLNLTKQMIEIRTILNKVDSSSAHLTLPSIVVIGSQSSGKSSVLESIVGKEFLPKGSNMVTRRPIELTLVNTPNSNNVTADFPSMRLYNIKDFKEVKRMLMELNMAVPTSEAVSEEPIQLTIKSSRVPDLSLVDLPGYIQVEAADQPLELKSKIRDLCEKYLTAPNIILAISAADVDLANSSALKASKAADPKGLRTIGVITKLDLVDPEKARSILNNKKYPLSMGYVGVITKAPSSINRKHLGLFGETPSSSLGGIFSKGQHNQNTGDENVNGLKQIVSHQFEKAYFRENKSHFANCQVSTKKLREKLIKILEISMSNALEPTSTLIQQELDDTSYLFKVEFNDRHLTQMCIRDSYYTAVASCYN